MADADWDLSEFFTSVDDAAYRDFRSALEAELASICARARELAELDASNSSDWAALLTNLEAANSRLSHLSQYLGCAGAADATDERIQIETAGAAGIRAEFAKALVLVREAFGAAADEAFSQLLSEPSLADVRYFLERIRKRSSWSMGAELETLAADLDTTGLSAWGRLYDQISGNLQFDLEIDGQASKRLPVSMTRSLLEDPDASTRRAALKGANRAWEGVADTAAACLNAIAGTRLALYGRRDVPSFLDPALFDAAISRKTLDVMLETVESRAEIGRRYYRRKAELLGVARLGFQDLMAPLPLDATEQISWDDAQLRVTDAFAAFYPALGEFAKLAFERRWIDYSPRDGKRPGGFCASSWELEQSRIFLTYNGAPGDVSTLAHELGHAFHSSVMRGMRPWARRYPMTLAETASTFAEQVVVDAMAEDEQASQAERAAVLDGAMQGAATMILNIPMRFQFERALYEERASGELPVSRLCELMRDAQRNSYGDALADDQLDPWFWASKLHFYITGLSFYNFPYTFGYLFSQGIFARAKQEGPDFFARYEELLRNTANQSAEDVARKSLGIDLEAPEFWNASLDLAERTLERFESSCDGLELTR
jgi:oligoendopeptidase F